MNRKISFTFLCVTLVLNAIQASAQTTQFTHQGNLGLPVNGTNYEFEFKLFDTPVVGTGTQQGQTYSASNVGVTEGAFTVTISFDASVFTGAELYLETGWRDGNAPDPSYTVLSSREKVTAVYANRSLSAATADNATQLGGLPPSNFIQNTTSPQAGTSFNIGGNGTVGGTLSANTVSGNAVNAATQFDLDGRRILSAPGDNLFAGVEAGISNTTGWMNTYFGYNAGKSNSTGNENAFFGYEAGRESTGSGGHAFFGAHAGRSTTHSEDNSFFGYAAGVNNTLGNNNVFFGSYAGRYNLTGGNNTFIGAYVGMTNTKGNRNTLIGRNADVAADNLSNATAIGYQAVVGQSNSLVLGSIKGVNNAQADTTVGIGTSAPSFRLHVVDPSNAGLRVQTNSTGGAVASFGGNGDLLIDAPGVVGGRFTVKENGNTGIGTAAPAVRLHVRTNSGNVLIGDAGCGAGFGGIGFGASLSGCTNYSLLGDGTNTYINRPAGGSIFFRSGNATQMSINPGGTVSISILTGGGTTQLCRNPVGEISVCSSSLRYKSEVAPFRLGLSLVNQLQPITFNWKASGEADLGLGAEEVAKVEPLLVTHNGKGEVEGVKYDRVALILLNAVREQQEQIREQQSEIESQSRRIKQQQADLEELKRLFSARSRSGKTRK